MGAHIRAYGHSHKPNMEKIGSGLQLRLIKREKAHHTAIAIFSFHVGITFTPPGSVVTHRAATLIATTFYKAPLSDMTMAFGKQNKGSLSFQNTPTDDSTKRLGIINTDFAYLYSFWQSRHHHKTMFCSARSAHHPYC